MRQFDGRDARKSKDRKAGVGMNNNDVILSRAHADKIRVFNGIDRTVRRLQVERNSFVHYFSYGIRCHENRLPLWGKESIQISVPSPNERS